MRDGTENRIFLTFDDGPDPIWTPRILEVLHHSRARATFFVISPLALRFSHLVRRMIHAGHGVELHCAEHIRHTELTHAEVEVGGMEPRHALEDEQLEHALRRHGVPIERLLSVRVVTSARLLGRAGQGLAHDLSAAAKVLNVVD